MTEAKRELNNAIIKHADFCIERGLTYWVELDYGDGGQGFGGYLLGGEFGCKAIEELLLTVGVEKWSHLKGRAVRAEHSHNKVHRLGHFLEDKWLDLEELAKPYRKETKERELYAVIEGDYEL